MRALVRSIFCKERHTNHLRLGAETGQGALGLNFPGWSDRDNPGILRCHQAAGQGLGDRGRVKRGWSGRVVCVAGGGGL